MSKVEKRLSAAHKDGAQSLYYINHMLTKRKLVKHELDESIRIMEKTLGELRSLRSTAYGTDG